MNIYLYTYDSNVDGIKIIIDSLREVVGNAMDIVVINSLENINANDLVIPITINNCYELSKNNRLKHHIAFLMDSPSLGAKSIIRHYIKVRLFNKNIIKELLKYYVFTYKEYCVSKMYKKIFLVSQNDINYLIEKYTRFKNKFLLATNGFKQFNETTREKNNEQFTLGYLASFSDGAFEDIYWFLKDIFPKIRKEIQNLKIIIAGRNISINIKKKFQSIDGVQVIGEVESLNDFFNSVSATITTVRKECGILNKVLDSFFYDTPVIGSSHNFKAFHNAKNFHEYIEANGVEEYISAIYYLKNPDNYDKIVQNANLYIKQNHNIYDNYKILIQTIEDLKN